MRTDEIHPGDIIAGKYRVRAILGRTHGLLVEGFHTEFDQRVIIKILTAGASEAREIERFRREARTLAKLESEHVARIIDVGTEPDGSFYIVRQYLEGMDLARYIRETGPLPLVDAALLVLQIGEALAETHGHGIIVRELSPEHIFLTQRAGGAPLAKITDFGTAKLMKEAAAPTAGGDLTATAMFGLSPYSSPELVRKAKNVDVRTDVWSLGAVFYELLTGQPPFRGEAAFLMLAITKENPAPLSSLRGDLPRDVEDILGWSMAKDLDARFKNIHAFAHALAPFASTEGKLLAERIGQITDAARRRKAGGSVPPPAPSFPSQRAEQPFTARTPMSEDSVTSLRSQPPPASQRDDYPASIPPAPPLPSGLGRAMPNGGDRRAQTTPPPARQQAMDRRVTLAALAVGAILLPLMVVLFFVRRERQTDLQIAQQMASVSAMVAPPPPPPVVTVIAPAATASAPPPPPPPPPPSATASAEAAPTASEEPTAPPEKHARPAAHNTRRIPTPPRPPPPPREPPKPKETSSGGSGEGTLLAIAVGGSCSFSVNGAGKGTSSSLRVQLKPGTYSVTCKPSDGAAKSKNVTVKSGETAMAAFKLGG